MEENNSIPFLDMTIKREDNHLLLSTYRKPTHTNVYIPYASHHPDRIKQGVIRNLYDRARKVCDASLLPKEEEYLKDVFRSNGYPPEYIRRTIRPRPPRKEQETTEKRFVSLPYVKGVSEKLGKILARYGITAAHKSRPTLKNQLCHLKDPIPRDQRKGAIYKITCGCSQQYIGETLRPFQTRIKEHKVACHKGEQNKSAVAEHRFKCDKDIEWDNVTVLDYESNFRKRKIKEAMEIQENSTSPGFGMNRDTGFFVHPVWSTFIPSPKTPDVSPSAQSALPEGSTTTQQKLSSSQPSH